MFEELPIAVTTATQEQMTRIDLLIMQETSTVLQLAPFTTKRPF